MSIRALFVRLAILSSAILSNAGAFQPNLPDGRTLHLWHLDEADPPFKDAGTNPTEMQGLFNGARAGTPSAPGCGLAVNFNNFTPDGSGERPYGSILMARPVLDTGSRDNVERPISVMGANGAFTMEAIVKLDRLPADSPGLAADIVTLDDELDENRVFLFRIEKPGFLSFVPISGNAVRGGGLATIPTSGPHAIDTEHWFHVAVTYDGRENVADNLKFYWTRLDSGAHAANRIGGGTLTADLSPALADFALGNTGKFNNLGPFEFFPGSIDEVRISDIARVPEDFFFVPPEIRETARVAHPAEIPVSPPSRLVLRQVWVNDVRAPLDQPLELGPGQHRLNFDFGFPEGASADPLAVRCRLEGLDEDWHPTAQGMTLTWEMLDAAGGLLAQTTFSATRSSPGWKGDVLDSAWSRRSEPLFVPEMTRSVRVLMSSGTPDTTGCWAIDDLTLTRSGKPDANFWTDGNFSDGERLDQIGGVPKGWSRHGTEPAIARVMLGATPGLGLLDAEQNQWAYWKCERELPVRPRPGGETFLVGWSEAYNVIPGSWLRASYLNVPPGKYTFRAISAVPGPQSQTTELAFPFRIRQPYWKLAWFAPLLAVCGVIVIGWALFLNYQRKSRNKLVAIRLINAIERDRARIARDMHDDLGTRVSLLKHASSAVTRSLGGEPEIARVLADRLEVAARDLVRAMDGLVWAVNPSNDTLEHMAAHMSGVAQEMFRDSPVRLRILIPTALPAERVSADFRHHFSLAAKEALHNIFKHAGPCVATFELHAERGILIARVTDTGNGFDPANPKAGNGLLNLASRAAEIGGTCDFVSAPGEGTRVVLTCPLPKVPIAVNS